MLIHRSVLDFVESVQLALENNKVTSFLSVEVNSSLLELLKSVDDLKEVLVLQEELVIASVNLSDDLLNWEEKSALVEVGLKVNMAELFKLVLSWLLNSNDVLDKVVLLSDLSESSGLVSEDSRTNDYFG